MALILTNKETGRLSEDMEDYPEGIVLPVDKPYRWTSADVIRKMKFCACRHFHKKNLKVGHAGTLDPLATGVLLVCIGKATKLAEELQKHEKEYVAGISFGATTPSYDLEKEIDMLYPTDGVNEDALRKVLPSFLGEQEQVAPLFSAKSVDGVRAYELARREWKRMQRTLPNAGMPSARGGDHASDPDNECQSPAGFDHSAAAMLNRQMINISEIELLRFCPEGANASSEAPDLLSSDTNPDGSENLKNSRIHVADNSAMHLPHAEIRVTCSKGTYIRALARDLGEALGSGAHLDSLRRTRTGGFRISDALTIGQSTTLFLPADQTTL